MRTFTEIPRRRLAAIRHEGGEKFFIPKEKPTCVEGNCSQHVVVARHAMRNRRAMERFDNHHADGTTVAVSR
jgi:hypothetical protein